MVPGSRADFFCRTDENIFGKYGVDMRGLFGGIYETPFSELRFSRFVYISVAARTRFVRTYKRARR